MIEGQRTKPMVDGMYTRHPMYSVPVHSSEQKRLLQIEQGRRVQSKRDTRANAQRLLKARLI